MERSSENKSTDNGFCMCAETRSNILFKQSLTVPSKIENKNSLKKSKKSWRHVERGSKKKEEATTDNVKNKEKPLT